MYNEVKLEKGMYHLSGKSFVQALEEADPSSQYVGSPLAKLDAYERQLKRFDIRVSGAGCDRVEKFFTTTESAVLFPEFVRRAVLQGMRETVLDRITAVVSRSESNLYQGCELQTLACGSVTAGQIMPETKIRECEEPVPLAKYGCTVNATYEAVRQQRLDVFALMLRRVGTALAGSVTSEALAVLMDCKEATTVDADKFGYADLVGLFGGFNAFDMKVLLVSPDVMAAVMVMPQMAEVSSKEVNEVVLPFGTRMVSCRQLGTGKLVALDTDYALEMIQSSDVVLETDKLIDRQLDRIGVSINVGFRVLMDGAVSWMEIEE